MKQIAVGNLGEFWYGDYKEPFEQLEGGVPGHPVGVVLKADDGKLLCAFCGVVADNLGSHAAHKHGLKATDYKREVGLLQQTALVSERVRQRMIARGLRTRDSGELAVWRSRIQPGQHVTRGARNKRRPEALNKTGRCLAQIVAVARTVARENNGRITLRRMKERGIGQHAMDPFGGFARVVELAGFTPRSNPGPYTDAYLLRALRSLADELGRTPSESDLRRYGLPSNVTYKNHFGLYSEACRRAGLVSNLPTPVSSDDEVAILVAYAITGSTESAARRVHRSTVAVVGTLARYGISLRNWGYSPSQPEGRTLEHRAAMERAGEIARRLAGWPEPEAAA